MNKMLRSLIGNKPIEEMSENELEQLLSDLKKTKIPKDGKPSKSRTKKVKIEDSDGFKKAREDEILKALKGMKNRNDKNDS